MLRQKNRCLSLKKSKAFASSKRPNDEKNVFVEIRLLVQAEMRQHFLPADAVRSTADLQRETAGKVS